MRTPVAAARRQRRDLAVEPVLLVGQRTPGGFHSPVAVEGGLVRRAFGEVRAILGIFAKDI